MTVHDVETMVRAWAPPDIAWERDAIGLQVGDARARVRGVLVALELTPAVIAEAVRNGMNLVVTHHPLLFRPLRALTEEDPSGALALRAARSGLQVFSAHTNLDFTREGTSFALARRLGLGAIRFLTTPYRREVKIVTFLPAAAADRVTAAMAAAGAGVIGGYTGCSFRSPGTGTFRGGAGTSPAVGRAGRREAVPEVRLEMLAHRDVLPAAIAALRRHHPYEEPAVDVVPLENLSPDHGKGAIGELPRPLTLRAFLQNVKRRLGAPVLRFTGVPNRRIRTVAVCGGAGAELLGDAVRAGADVFVTADVTYHAFHDAAGRIALVDAGHFETEAPVLEVVARRLRSLARARRSRCPVRVARSVTNPIAGM
jgi:dinuclear metal center YbgI/SA1388 family protein